MGSATSTATSRPQACSRTGSTKPNSALGTFTKRLRAVQTRCSDVPIARYFIFVGSTIAALLFIAGWCLPTPPPMSADQQLGIDRAVIRIRSARKWPEKVVLDTSQPAIAAPAVEEPPAAPSVPLRPDETADQSNHEAMAQFKPDPEPAAAYRPILRTKRRVAKAAARSTRVARGAAVRRLARAEVDGGCCQFGWWIDNGQAGTNAMPRRRAAARWPD